MGKQIAEPARVEEPVPAGPPEPVKIPIAEAAALGVRVRCPGCSGPAETKPAQSRVRPSDPALPFQPSAEIQTAWLWAEINCPKCGRKLYKAADHLKRPFLVEVVEPSPATAE